MAVPPSNASTVQALVKCTQCIELNKQKIEANQDPLPTQNLCEDHTASRFFAQAHSHVLQRETERRGERGGGGGEERDEKLFPGF